MPTLAEDRDAIRDLLARHFRYVDAAEGPEWAATYTDDGEFTMGGDLLVGREALSAFAMNHEAGAYHHIAMNEIIDVDGDTATCLYSIAVIAKAAVVTTGRSTDEFRRVDGGWLFSRRTFTADPQ